MGSEGEGDRGAAAGAPPSGERRRHRSRSRSRERRRRSRSRSRSHSPKRRRSSPKRRRSRSRSRGERRRSRSRSRERRRKSSRSPAEQRLPPPPPLPPGGLPPPPERGWLPPPPSYPPPPAFAQRGSRPPPPPEAPPAVGSIHHATVESVRPFGVFVSLPGFHRHALIHANAVAADMRFSREDPDEDKVKALEWVCARGARVYVKVTEVGDDPVRGGMRLGASMVAVDQATGADLDPTGALAAAHGGHGGHGGGGSDEAPELNSIHKATVAGIRPFGLFVALAGYRKHGLVHSSQVSDHMGFTRDDADEEKVAALSGVVSLGEAVFVKVVEVEMTPEAGGFKLGCSMKLVNQRTGADLDKAGTQYRPRGAGFGRGDDEDERIGRKAAAVRAGVVEWGHHAAGVRPVDGKAYDLVGDEEGGDWAAPGAAQAPIDDRMVTNANAMARVGGGAAPAGMLADDDGGDGAPAFASVEEAMAVLERYKRKAAKKEAKKKDKKAKKERKEKHHKSKSERKEKKAAKHRGRSSSSSSSSS